MLPVFQALGRDVLKEIPSCPRTMKYLRWTICRRRSVPFSSMTEKETMAFQSGRKLAKYLKWSRAWKCLKVKLSSSVVVVDGQSKISGCFVRCEPFWGHYRQLCSCEARFRSVIKLILLSIIALHNIDIYASRIVKLLLELFYHSSKKNHRSKPNVLGLDYSAISSLLEAFTFNSF